MAETIRFSQSNGYPGSDQSGETVVSADFAGQQIFPTNTTQTLSGITTQIGGLSGLTYDAANNRYYLISDDRGDRTIAGSGTTPPPADNISPRFYTADINFGANGLADGSVTFTGVTLLRDADGKTFAPLKLDPEDIVVTHNNTVFVSSEGEVNITAGRITDPFVNEFDLATGQQVRSLLIPQKFLPVVQDTNGNGKTDAGDTQLSGVRNNLVFESLTITPDQKTLYTATESALFQDGAISTITGGSQARIIQYNLATGQPEKEFLYPVESIPFAPTPATGSADNGLVDLLAIDNRGTMLALERSFAVGKGNTIRIYEISLQGATDISAINSLSSLTDEQLSAIRTVSKRLVLNLNDLNLSTGTDNIEGIEFGPKLADGRQSIVLVSDNNFGATQFTQILALDAYVVPTVIPTVETNPERFNDPNLPFSDRADSDDPAIYLNATDAEKSLILTTLKNGGIEVHDLAGNTLQTFNPGNIRYNNVDLLYGFKLGGQTIDIAVASDRNNDKLVIFKINASPVNGKYIEDITDGSIGTLFQAAPFDPPYSASARSAYGLALYHSPLTDDSYVFANRRQTGDVAQYKLTDSGNGTIGATRVRQFTLPIPAGAPASTEAQTEGTVVDQELGYLYIGQEDVGIWKFQAEPNGGTTGTLIEKVKALGGSHIANDVEGLTIYYGANGTGYLLASSQGDSTFAVYTREGTNDYIGQFAVGTNGAIDSVQQSDGADVINVPLGANFPFGAFITQDGSNDPAKIINGANVSTNFKYVPWENIANTLGLKIDTTSYNPRQPKNYVTTTPTTPSLVSTIVISGNATDLFPSSGANQNRLGGFGSDLYYDAKENVYYALVDRGPGGGVISYQTRVEKFTIDLDPATGAINSYKLVETIPFTVPAGATLNGKTYAIETPFNGLNALLLNGDSAVLGLSQDPEGFVVGANGNLFVSDEYGPSIYEFSPTGSFIRAFTEPANVLPKNGSTPNFAADSSPTAGRQDNRGYEGLAISPDGTKLFAVFQDPLQNEGTPNGRSSRNVRIVRFDVATGQSDAQYLYQLEALADINDRIPGTKDDFGSTSQGRNIGISSLTAISDRQFLVIERDNRGIGVGDVQGAIPVGSKRIYQIDLTGATDVSGLTLTSNTLPTGVTPVKKALFLDIADELKTAGQTIPEKFEGVAIGPRLADGSYALLVATDNDFSVTQDGNNTQFDVYSNGTDSLQVPIGAAAPVGYSLLPSYIYSFKTDPTALSGYSPSNSGPLIQGDASNDTLTGGETSDRLFGYSGDDVLIGYGGNDTLIGGTGSDGLDGGSGNDVLRGDKGNDYLQGRNGADLFIVASGDGTDIIADFKLSEGDRIGLSGGLTFGQLSVTQEGSNTLIKAGTASLAVLNEVQASTLTSAAFTAIA